MRKYVVATDSGCDLPMGKCAELDIHPLQMKYVFGETTYVDSMLHSDCRTFYARMRAGEIPHTSQVNVMEFVEFWETLLPLGLPIVHIALGSGISGTFRNGQLAVDVMKEQHPEAKVFLVDSTLASVGYGVLAIRAAELADEGRTPEECVEWLEAHKAAMNTYYTTGDLTYLYRSGRVSRAGMVIAHALGIWPILNLDLEGHLIVQEKCRGKKNTVARIHAIIRELAVDPAGQTLYICHSDIPEEAKEFGDAIRDEFGFRDVYYTYIGPTIGTHSGPGLMAAFFFGKDRTMKHPGA